MMIRDKLITAGVKNLREFGYPNCNKKNILTDEVYKKFFISMLNDNKGHSVEIDIIIDRLLKELLEKLGKEEKVDILIALKKGARLVYEDKWLWYDDTLSEWVVCQREYRAKKTKEICRTENEETACLALMH